MKDYRSEHARRASRAALDQIIGDGSLTKRRLEIYEALFHHGPATANEIFQHCELHGNTSYRHNVQARMTELVDLGVVEALEMVDCRVTGNKATLYDVTDALPDPEAMKRKRARTKKPSKKVMQKALREMRQHVRAGVKFDDGVVQLMRWVALQAGAAKETRNDEDV